MAKEHKCDICGRPLFKALHCQKHILCKKHYNQFKKYGKALDNNPRCQTDKNEFHIHGKRTYMDLYDKDYNVIAQAVIDTEDLNKIKYTKWKITSNGKVMNNPKVGKGTKCLANAILETDKPIILLNDDPLDYRKENLGFIDFKKIPKEIKIKSQNSYTEEEVIYVKWCQEIQNHSYRFPPKEPYTSLTEERKEEIKKQIQSNEEVQRL